MKKITGEEFVERTLEDSFWCSKLKEHLEVTGSVDMSHSHITHLSKFLYFSGCNSDNISALFKNCYNLKEACGSFANFVDFSSSGVQSTKNLKVLGADSDNWSSSFYDCCNLRKLEGEFAGSIYLENANVEEINAVVKQGAKVNIANCNFLPPKSDYLSNRYIIDEDLRVRCLEVKRKEDIARLVKEVVKKIKKENSSIEGF